MLSLSGMLIMLYKLNYIWKLKATHIINFFFKENNKWNRALNHMNHKIKDLKHKPQSIDHWNTN